MTKDYDLKLFAHPLQGEKAIGNMTQVIEKWARSTTFTGGPWQGTFKVFGEKEYLEQWFYEYLGYHLEEVSFGQPSWEGFIWEIDFVDFDKTHWTRLTQRGRRRRRTYETLFNKVKVAFIDPVSGDNGETAWYEDAISQARYGVKTEVIYRDVESVIAENLGQEFLAMHAYPDPELIALEEGVEEPYLEVSVVGYVATAQFQFTGVTDDSSSDVGTWVEEIFDADLEFLTRFRRVPNARSLQQSLGERMRAWDLLENLLTLRNVAGTEHYNITVEPGRRISYDVWSPNPIGYFWNGALTTPNFDNMEERPRLIRPGVYRDTGYISGYATKAVTGSFFETPQDFLLETIEVDAEGELVPRLGVYVDEESLRSFKFGKK